MAARVGLHVVGAGFDGGFQHGVGRARRGRIGDLAHVREHVRHGAGGAEVAAVLREDRADRAAGAVAVVGQRLDDDGDAARAVALVADRLVVLGVAAGGLLDGALDVVLGHVLGARGLDGEAQARVHVGIGQPVSWPPP